MGGKFRIRKELSSFLNSKLKEGQPFVDLMCGSCWIVSEIDQNRLVIANDIHKYLIAMWVELQKGWKPPTSITEEEYKYIRENKDEKPYLSGFVGFACSFGGKWFSCYARRKREERSYAMGGHNSCLRKIEKMKGVQFINKDYRDVEIPRGSLVYCDIPYRGAAQYSKKECGVFIHEDFYKWVDENKYNYDIYISEYKRNVPEGFDIVWEKKSLTGVRNKKGKPERTEEVLITPRR